ncbi:G-protein-coupled receptor [Tieghemostelium lacteum]|uniref:G-protein-coupled receptor n=1 Tax=Tieghemostelium lacteum TaxID=361077 RepID=A0A152AAK6_TIELA|nr:G-protein-coupled receptor [Tieghemostelium lacteum]|eukprot:KYR03107.1 G-protein-coupled receptor [Tieghemostelium lacteum]
MDINELNNSGIEDDNLIDDNSDSCYSHNDDHSNNYSEDDSDNYFADYSDDSIDDYSDDSIDDDSDDSTDDYSDDSDNSEVNLKKKYFIQKIKETSYIDVFMKDIIPWVFNNDTDTNNIKLKFNTLHSLIQEILEDYLLISQFIEKWVDTFISSGNDSQVYYWFLSSDMIFDHFCRNGLLKKLLETDNAEVLLLIFEKSVDIYIGSYDMEYDNKTIPIPSLVKALKVIQNQHLGSKFLKIMDNFTYLTNGLLRLVYRYDKDYGDLKKELLKDHFNGEGIKMKKNLSLEFVESFIQLISMYPDILDGNLLNYLLLMTLQNLSEEDRSSLKPVFMNILPSILDGLARYTKYKSKRQLKLFNYFFYLKKYYGKEFIENEIYKLLLGMENISSNPRYFEKLNVMLNTIIDSDMVRNNLQDLHQRILVSNFGQPLHYNYWVNTLLSKVYNRYGDLQPISEPNQQFILQLMISETSSESGSESGSIKSDADSRESKDTMIEENDEFFIIFANLYPELIVKNLKQFLKNSISNKKYAVGSQGMGKILRLPTIIDELAKPENKGKFENSITEYTTHSNLNRLYSVGYLIKIGNDKDLLSKVWKKSIGQLFLENRYSSSVEKYYYECSIEFYRYLKLKSNHKVYYNVFYSIIFSIFSNLKTMSKKGIFYIFYDMKLTEEEVDIIINNIPEYQKHYHLISLFKMVINQGGEYGQTSLGKYISTMDAARSITVMNELKAFMNMDSLIKQLMELPKIINSIENDEPQLLYSSFKFNANRIFPILVDLISSMVNCKEINPLFLPLCLSNPKNTVFSDIQNTIITNLSFNLGSQELNDIHQDLISTILSEWDFNELTWDRKLEIFNYCKSIISIDDYKMNRITYLFKNHLDLIEKQRIISIIEHDQIKSLFFLLNTFNTTNNNKYNNQLPDHIIQKILCYFARSYDPKISYQIFNFGLVSKTFHKEICKLFRNKKLSFNMYTTTKFLTNNQWSFLNQGIYYLNYYDLSSFDYKTAEEIFYQASYITFGTPFNYTVNREMNNLTILKVEIDNWREFNSLIAMMKHCHLLERVRIHIGYYLKKIDISKLQTLLTELFQNNHETLQEVKYCYVARDCLKYFNQLKLFLSELFQHTKNIQSHQSRTDKPFTLKTKCINETTIDGRESENFLEQYKFFAENCTQLSITMGSKIAPEFFENANFEKLEKLTIVNESSNSSKCTFMPLLSPIIKLKTLILIMPVVMDILKLIEPHFKDMQYLETLTINICKTITTECLQYLYDIVNTISSPNFKFFDLVIERFPPQSNDYKYGKLQPTNHIKTHFIKIK